MEALLQVIICAFSGLAAYFLSLGFRIPPGLDFFQFLAVLGTMAGYGLGGLAPTKSVDLRNRALTIIAALLLGTGATVFYWILIVLGGSGAWFTLLLAFVLVTAFACLGYIISQIANMRKFSGETPK